MPSARAVKTSGAKMTRFSTALVCAAIKRRAQAEWSLSLGLGLAIAPINPRTMIRSSMYGTQNRPVIATVSVSPPRTVSRRSTLLGVPQHVPSTSAVCQFHVVVRSAGRTFLDPIRLQLCCCGKNDAVALRILCRSRAQRHRHSDPIIFFDDWLILRLVANKFFVVVRCDNRFRVLDAACQHRKNDEAKKQSRLQINLPSRSAKLHAAATAGRVNDIQHKVGPAPRRSSQVSLGRC